MWRKRQSGTKNTSCRHYKYLVEIEIPLPFVLFMKLLGKKWSIMELGEVGKMATFWHLTVVCCTFDWGKKDGNIGIINVISTSLVSNSIKHDMKAHRSKIYLFLWMIEISLCFCIISVCDMLDVWRVILKWLKSLQNQYVNIWKLNLIV